MNKNIKSWPREDLPREQLIRNGARTLSDSQLLAILLGSGTKDLDVISFSHQLISNYGNILELSKSSAVKLLKEKGLGPAKVSAFLAAVELSKRLHQKAVLEEASFSCSEQVAEYFKPHYSNQRHESFLVVFMNNKNKFIAHEELFNGTIDRTAVYPREIVRKAVEHDATRLIVLHNHPSGSLQPSSEDIRLTEELKKTLKLLDIDLLDHIILAGTSYYSFADSNML